MSRKWAWPLYRDRKSCCRSGHCELQATGCMPLWALAITLVIDKNTSLFRVLARTRYDSTLTCHSVQRRRLPPSRRGTNLSSSIGAGDSLEGTTTTELTHFFLWRINSPGVLAGSDPLRYGKCGHQMWLTF